MNPPPPILPAAGCVTAKANAVAIAASTALPPRFNTSHPTCDACGQTLTTRPFFAITIGTAPEKLADARRGIEEELAALVAEPPPADALERARRYLIGNFEIDRQRSAVRAAHMAIDALYGLGADAQRRYAAHVAAVTADDVLRVARRVIDPERAVVAVIRP